MHGSSTVLAPDWPCCTVLSKEGFIWFYFFPDLPDTSLLTEVGVLPWRPTRDPKSGPQSPARCHCEKKNKRQNGDAVGSWDDQLSTP